MATSKPALDPDFLHYDDPAAFRVLQVVAALPKKKCFHFVIEGFLEDCSSGLVIDTKEALKTLVDLSLIEKVKHGIYNHYQATPQGAAIARRAL